MKKNLLLSLMISVSIFSGCSSGKEITGVWVNKEKIQGKTFGSLFIIVLTADIQARVKLEKDLAAIAESRGLKTVKSMDVMPTSLSDPKTPTKEEIVSKVKASGCDGVFVSALLKKEEDVQHVAGSTAYTVMPDYSWTGNYFGFYSHWSPTVSTAGYVDNQKSYFMQSNLYDAASEEIMWAVKSEVFNPTDLNSFSRKYTAALMSQLKKAKLIKK